MLGLGKSNRGWFLLLAALAVVAKAMRDESAVVCPGGLSVNGRTNYSINSIKNNYEIYGRDFDVK